MRIAKSIPRSLSKLWPLAALGTALALGACTPNLEDKLACDNSLQCPTGYYCGSDGKCQQGATSPEIALITPTAGVFFSGVINLQMTVIDPAVITSVSVSLSGPGADAGAPVAATAGQGANVYAVSLDTRALGIASDGSYNVNITATNANGKSSTLTAPLQIQDQPPAIGTVSVSPSSIYDGQSTTISFSVGEMLASLPVVKLTPPDNSGPRYAAYVSDNNNDYSYQFVPVPGDPSGLWHVQISATDSYGNSSSTAGTDSFTLAPCVTSSQCPAGSYCAANGSCQSGDSGPAVTVLTNTAGATLSGVIQLQIQVVDPVTITGVSVSLSGAIVDAGSVNVAATAGANNVYTAAIDTRALGIALNGAVTATVTATDSEGKTGTASVQFQLDDAPPVINAVTIMPTTVAAGEPASISFASNEPLATQPVVKLTAPDSSLRYAAYVSVSNSGNSYTYSYNPLASDPLGVWHVQISADDVYGNTFTTSGADSFNLTAAGSQTVTFSAVRSGSSAADFAIDARAFYLRSGDSTIVTATFGAALSGLPTASLCPLGVGNGAACAFGSAGSVSYSVAAGSAANSYTFTIPDVVPTGSNEGTHVLSVTGTNALGAQVTGSTNVVFDFTAPAFSVQQFNPGNLDTQGREMVSAAATGTLQYLAAIDEPVADFSTVTAAIDGVTSVPPATTPQMPTALPQFEVTLGGTLASTPPAANSHSLAITICDLANNCTTAQSTPFVEVDLTPGVFNFIVPTPSDSYTLPDGGLATPTAFRPGQTLSMDVLVDRELSNTAPSPLKVGLPILLFQQDGGVFQDGGVPVAAAGYPQTPFEYNYDATIPAGTPDGTYPVGVYYGSYDGYGNSLVSSATTPNVGLPIKYVTIKSSVPTLSAVTPAGLLLSSSSLSMGESGTTTCFVSISNGTYDDLKLGQVSACFNPQQVNGQLSCSTVGSQPALTISPVTYYTELIGNSASPTPNGVGCVNITPNGVMGDISPSLLITYTDQAGNVGFLANTLNVYTAPPVLDSWSIDRTQVPPYGTANLTVTFSDPAGLLGVPSGFVTGAPPLSNTYDITVGPTVSLGNGSYRIPFTMPYGCIGSGTPMGSTPINVGVTAQDAVLNTYNSAFATLTSISCIPAPQVVNSSFSATTVPAGGSVTATITVNEDLGLLPASPAPVTGTVGTNTQVTTSASAPNSATPRIFTVTYKMPSTCLGQNNAPSDGVPFPVYVQLYDGANTTSPISIGNITCVNAPRVISYNWNQTVVSPGGTAIATLAVNVPLTVAYGSSSTSYSGLSVSPSPASGTATAAVNDPLAYTVAFTFNACGGSGQAPDGTPIPVNAVITDGYASATVSIGTLTCTNTSIASATVTPSSVYLVKQPFPDGTLRSTVYASPGSLTGYTGSGTGIQLVASQNGVTLGSGPLLSDGSVADFQLSTAATQVTLTFTDLLSNTKLVTAGRYNEQLLINGTGAYGNAVNQNPFQLIDVSTGDDTFFPAPYWVDGGPGVDGGNAGPVTAAQADGGLSSGYALSLVASSDEQILTVSDAPPFILDAGTDAGHMTYQGAETFGNPLINSADGGLFNGQTPPARYYSTMVSYPYATQLYLVGGYGTDGGLADPSGTVWQWSRDNGWSKSSPGFDGGVPATEFFALGFDSNNDLLAFGSNGVAGLYNNGSQWWGDAGTFGYPIGDGGVGAAGLLVYGSSYGPASYVYQYAGTNYNNNTNMTVMNASGGGSGNCIIAMSGCGVGAGSTYYCPGGTYALYSCATANGLANSVHLQAAVAVAEASLSDGGTYGIFSFGGKYNSQTGSYMSNDFYGGQLSYINGSLTTNWVTLTPAAGSPTPPARVSASLYYIPQTNRVGLYGGYSSSGYLNDSWEYDLVTNVWVEIDNPHANAIVPAGRYSEANAASNGNLYIFSGAGFTTYDAWTIGRESRTRIIAKVPINSQLTNPGAASIASLNVNLLNPNVSFSQFGRTMQGHSTQAQPDLTSFDSTYYYDLYVWTGSAWAFVETAQTGVQTVSIPGSLLQPYLTNGDGNIYLMVASSPVEYQLSYPPSISLDSLQFSLSFQ